MDVLARTNRHRSNTNGLPVLNHRSAGGNIDQGYFVSTWNRLTGDQISLAEALARGYIGASHRYVIAATQADDQGAAVRQWRRHLASLAAIARNVHATPTRLVRGRTEYLWSSGLHTSIALPATISAAYALPS